MQMEMACNAGSSTFSKVKTDIEPVRLVHPTEPYLETSCQVHHLIQLIGLYFAQTGDMPVHYHQGMTRRVGISIQNDVVVLVSGNDEVVSVPR